MKLIIGFVILIGLFQQPALPSYKVLYRLSYSPDSTNIQRKGNENFFLFIKQGKESYYASENFLKSDSISALVKSGSLSEYDIIGNPDNRFKTKFTQFIQKSNVNENINVHETIGTSHYTYVIQHDLQWLIEVERDSILGYFCTKATTQYAGRDYEAWFTPEIPIPDGPYIFRGLPGLIIKLSDTRGHYVFTLQQFGEHKGKITEVPTFRKRQPIVIDRNKAFALREDARKDPMGAFTRATGISFENATVQDHGSSVVRPAKSAAKDRSWDNNPLELK